MRTTGPYRLPALPVRGTDRWGHFDHLPAPAGDFTPEALAVHERAYRRYRENYYEQEKRHDMQFAQRGAAEGSPHAQRSALS